MTHVQQLQPLDPRQRYTIAEACSYLRISRARIYEKIRAGDITVIKDGARSYAPGAEIIRLSSLPQLADQK